MTHHRDTHNRNRRIEPNELTRFQVVTIMVTEEGERIG